MKAWAKNERFAVLAVRLGRRRRLRPRLRKIGKAELVALADAGDGAISRGEESREKMSQQMRDVLAARPQRRNRQRQHMRAIEQIFAEMSAFDAPQQLAVGRGDDAPVNLPRLAPANRLDRAFLQRAKQLDLRSQGQFRDFVENQRAAGGFDEFARVAFGSAGKRALLVAE